MKKLLIIGVIAAFIFLALAHVGIMSFPIVSDAQDLITEKLWVHNEILDGERGNIYTLKSRFNIETTHWEDTGALDSWEGHWTVSGRMAAILKYGTTDQYNVRSPISISVLNLDDKSLVRDIPLNKDRYRYSIVSLSLDKGGKYVAINDDDGYLEVFSISDGQKVYELETLSSFAPIDWSADSNQIIYSAFGRNDHKGNIGQTPSIYILDLHTNKAEEICKGWAPKWDSKNDRIIFCDTGWGFDWGDLYILDRKTNVKKILAKHIRRVGYGFSPSGKNAIVFIGQNTFSAYHWPKFLTIINCDNPDLKYIIKSGIAEDEDFYWVDSKVNG